MAENNAPAALDTADTAPSYTPTFTAPDYGAERRREKKRNRIIGAIVAVLAIVAAFLIKGAIDDDNKLEASQIAAAQKFGDDSGWKHTGSWRIDDLISVDNVIGQVSLGTCVFDVKSPASRPNELQVFLPESSAYTSYDQAKRPAFRPFLISQLPAAAAEANKYGYYVSHCSLPAKPNS